MSDARGADGMTRKDRIDVVWRVGRRVGRTIYAQFGAEPSDDDQLIGVMDTPGLAEAVVRAHEAEVTEVEVATALDEALAEHDRDPRTDVWASFWDRLTDGGPIPPRYAVEVTATSEGVQAKVDRMRDLTERVSERNQRIKRPRGQPVEVTDEMVERAYRAFLGSDTAYVPNRVGLCNMRAALCAALEAEPQTE